MFIGLVMIHEWGHFIVARRNGVDTEEFGLGFPPRLWGRKLRKKQGDNTLYSFNLLPLGGFVKMKGEHDYDEEPGSFGAASLKAKTKIMLAGVGLNLLTAIVLFTIVAIAGMPKLISKAQFGEEQFTVKSDTKIIRNDVRVSFVDPDSPADKAGVKAGDNIKSISILNTCNTSMPECAKSAPITIPTADVLKEKTKDFASKTVAINLLRNKEMLTVQAHIRTKVEVDSFNKAHHCNDQNYKGNDAQCMGYFGIVPIDYTVQRSTWSAPVVAVGLSAQLTKLTFKGLWSAIKGLGSTIAGGVTGNKVARQKGQTQASEQVSGPVGIFFVLKEGARQGFVFILFIVAVISLTLAIMNVLPIPALDGGRLYLMLYYRKVLHKVLPQKTEERIVGGSFAALMLLFVLITVVDVKRFF